MSQTTLFDLSRWRWALTAAMHITFPAMTVGTSVFLVICYWMYPRTDEVVWLNMFRFWRRIFGWQATSPRAERVPHLSPAATPLPAGEPVARQRKQRRCPRPHGQRALLTSDSRSHAQSEGS